jgi:hypothetical protein
VAAAVRAVARAAAYDTAEDNTAEDDSRRLLVPVRTKEAVVLVPVDERGRTDEQQQKERVMSTGSSEEREAHHVM